jgi:hypothetical protein
MKNKYHLLIESGLLLGFIVFLDANTRKDPILVHFLHYLLVLLAAWLFFSYRKPRPERVV